MRFNEMVRGMAIFIHSTESNVKVHGGSRSKVQLPCVAAWQSATIRHPTWHYVSIRSIQVATLRETN